MLNEPIFDQMLDVKGLSCPLPLLKMKQILNTMAVGQVIKVITTDGGSVKDFSSFAAQTGHELLHQDLQDETGWQGVYRFWLKKCK